jgi:hypothetical protein
VYYEEKPGVAHWTWDWSSAEDGGMIFDPTLRKFIKNLLTHPQKRTVSHYTVTSLNPSAFGSVRGIVITQLMSRLQQGRLAVSTDCDQLKCTVTLKPQNVRRFQLTAAFLAYHRGPSSNTILVEINRVRINVIEPISLCVTQNGVWKKCAAELNPSIDRWVGNSGPARQSFAHPFVIVAGTQNSSLAASFLDNARYLSAGHAHASATVAPIILDSDMPLSILLDAVACPNLILLGGPNENSVSSALVKLVAGFPVRFIGDSFILGSHAFTGPKTGVAFTFPHAFNEAPVASSSSWKQQHRINFMVSFKLLTHVYSLVLPQFIVIFLSFSHAHTHTHSHTHICVYMILLNEKHAEFHSC